MIEVSVVIPTYNRRERLKEALKSVLAQKNASFEVLVIDDGSTDGTAEMIQSEFPSVHYQWQKNQGVSSARNHALKIARAPWIAFLDSDDLWHPEKLRTQLDFFEGHPDYKICQTEEIWIRNGKRVNPMKKHQKHSGWIFEKCLPLCVISPSAVMMHREVFENTGLFDETFPACEDYELWLRVACRYSVGLIPTPHITRFGGHEDQLSRKYEAMDQYRIRAIEKVLKSGILNEEQSEAARKMLNEKIGIYNLGAQKRGKAGWGTSDPKIKLLDSLSSRDRDFLIQLQKDYAFTFQELRALSVMARDFEMWQETSLSDAWHQAESEVPSHLDLIQKKQAALRIVQSQYEDLKASPKPYPEKSVKPKREALRPEVRESDKKIHGDCPVASPETVCCNLKTIDAVENCAFGCSYCTIQTFYGSEAVFDNSLAEKLDQIPIDPNRHYHYGTGQSSDSLIWGNRNGNLDALCNWARRHPNVLLEFKTKSDNIGYFIDNEGRKDENLPADQAGTKGRTKDVSISRPSSHRPIVPRDLPPNIVISWSLNPEIVIENEEHFTASLERRLSAARKIADQGIKVAFHFHPMIYYETWQQDYSSLARKVQAMFRPEEVLFISFGSVTFIKPVMQAIRKRGEPTRILQMNLVKAPHNKWTYPADLKIEMFQSMWKAFEPWREKVFFYLCMEEAKFWDATFGWHYATNELFESDFSQKCFEKINARLPPRGLSEWFERSALKNFSL